MTREQLQKELEELRARALASGVTPGALGAALLIEAARTVPGTTPQLHAEMASACTDIMHLIAGAHIDSAGLNHSPACPAHDGAMCSCHKAASHA